MKVRELIAKLLEKDPDDNVELEVEVNFLVYDESVNKLQSSVPVDEVASGNTPVLLKADLTINVDLTAEVY